MRDREIRAVLQRHDNVDGLWSFSGCMSALAWLIWSGGNGGVSALFSEVKAGMPAQEPESCVVDGGGEVKVHWRTRQGRRSRGWESGVCEAMPDGCEHNV